MPNPPSNLATLATFERHAYHHEEGLAIQALQRLLSAMEKKGLVDDQASDVDAIAAHTRMSAALAALFAAPAFQPTDKLVLSLLLYRRTLGDIVGASGFNSQQFWKLMVAAPPVSDDHQAQSRPILKRLLALDLDGVSEFHQTLQRLRGDLRMSVVINLLADTQVLTRGAERQRNWLIDHADLLRPDVFLTSLAPRLASAWMFCSYADTPNRHYLKKTLNRIISNWLARKLDQTGSDDSSVATVPGDDDFAVTPAPGPDTRTRLKPVLLVVAERFRANHAMHRCYAPSIAQLRARYHVIIIGAENQIDDASKPLADEIIHIDPSPSRISVLVDVVRTIAPDLIFFPSIGMSFWAIALANLRIAPIQFMSIGHPASSFSEHIDYMVLGRDVLGDPACFSETVIVREAPGNPVQPVPGYHANPPAPRLSPSIFKIAVPAMASKLSPAFLEACMALQNQAGRPIEYHFFPNRTGVSYRHLKASLQRMIAGCHVYPATNYDLYMSRLAQADLVLATYPFGNANSTVDALLLGKPVVALEGDEPAARTDRRMLRLAGAPEWLLAQTRDQYEKTALRLICDDQLRVDTANAIIASRPDLSLFESESIAYPTDFSDTVHWIAQHHHHLQKSGKKVWLPEERSGVGEAS